MGQMTGISDFYRHPRRARVEVSIASEGGFETLERVSVMSGRNAGSGWVPVEIDLSAYAGQRITLRLQLLPEGAGFEAGALTWWGSPRIALRPPQSAG